MFINSRWGVDIVFEICTFFKPPPPRSWDDLGGRSEGDDLRGRSEGDGPGETVFAYGYIKQLSAKIRKNVRKCAKMRENRVVA